MMTREQLIASLTLTTPEHCIYWSDGRYIDWSAEPSGGEGVGLELGDHSDAVCIDLTWEELSQLHLELTRTLLARQADE